MAFASTLAHAQALTSVTSLYVGYSSRKVALRPTGELKARLDSLDGELATAIRLGRNGEVRRLLSKGTTLLSGRPWDALADYNGSLLLRTDRVVVESQKPYAVRIEQLYSPSIELARSLSARARLVARPAGANAPGPVVKDLGAFDGVNRDLRESPFVMDFDLRDVPDGRYVVTVDVMDSARVIGTTSLPIVLRKGIDDAVDRLEREAGRAPQELRAEIFFPVDRLRNVNRGRLELRTLDIDKDFVAAEAVLAALKSGKHPFAGRTGDMERHYRLDAANEIMPYRLYVPSSYTAKQGAPLIIALHGLGATEDSFFDSYGRKLPELAEQHGYIMAAPLGYRVDGGYGWGVGAPPSDAMTRRSQELSELDVMETLAQVRKHYHVDESRIYLMGHSLGAIGTWKIAARYPDIWAALGLFSGQGTPGTIERMKRIPQFVVHGDADPTVNVRGSRLMVDAMKALGMDVRYIEVPGGHHTNVVEPNFAEMMTFFDGRKKLAGSTR